MDFCFNKLETPAGWCRKITISPRSVLRNIPVKLGTKHLHLDVILWCFSNRLLWTTLLTENTEGRGERTVQSESTYGNVLDVCSGGGGRLERQGKCDTTYWRMFFSLLLKAERLKKKWEEEEEEERRRQLLLPTEPKSKTKVFLLNLFWATLVCFFTLTKWMLMTICVLSQRVLLWVWSPTGWRMTSC